MSKPKRLRLGPIFMYYWYLGLTHTFGLWVGDRWLVVAHDIYHNASGIHIKFGRYQLWVTRKPMAWWLKGIKRYINFSS